MMCIGDPPCFILPAIFLCATLKTRLLPIGASELLAVIENDDD
jgi:hypothetical protein